MGGKGPGPEPDPVTCPGAAPMNDDECSGKGSCYYTGLRCDCGGMMGDRKWRCRGSGDACPAMPPADATACTNDGDMPLNCPYPDGSECRCEQDEWKCKAPPEPPGEAGGAPNEPPPPPPPPPAAGGAPDMP